MFESGKLHASEAQGSAVALSGRDRRARFPAINWWRRRVPKIAAVLTPFLIGALALLLWQLVDASNTLREAERLSQDRRNLLQEVLSLHQDIETGQRGYIITGKEEFLEPFVWGTTHLDPTFEQLNVLLAGDREENNVLSEIEKLSVDRVSFAQGTIDMERAGRGDLAQAAVSAGRGKAVMDAIRLRIATLLAREESRLSVTTERSNAAILRLRLISFGSLALLTTLLCGAAVTIWQTMQARQRVIGQLDDAVRRSEVLFDSAMDGILTLLPDGRIESMNRAATRMFGLEQAEAKGKNVNILYAEMPTEQYAASELAGMGLMPSGGGVIRHGRAKHVNGRAFPVDVAITLAVMADGPRFMAVVRDVSEREKIERMKSEFVATVSHELRTPLASISASLGLIVGGAAGEIGEKARHLTSMAHRNCARLVALVNDILDLEKLDAGQMELALHEQPLSAILERAVFETRPLAGGFGVEVIFLGGDAKVIVDEHRLIQVATNLLSNAIKFSPIGGTVVVAIEEGGVPTFTVADQGPGVPPDHRERIFERFSQVDASDSRDKGGTGLGLAICRQILAHMGGTIAYSEREGAGATFVVTLEAPTAEDDV